jgi:hypothetical protein
MPMRNFKTNDTRPVLFALLLVAVSLSGCAMSDDKLASFLVAPGKFALYTCPELAQRAKTTAARQRELEQLMAKAGAGSGGRLVSMLAYRPDYLSARGEMKDLREAAAAKKCDLPEFDNAGAQMSPEGAAPSAAGAAASTDDAAAGTADARAGETGSTR